MKISGNNSISDLFCIFHDGVIVNVSQQNNGLSFSVEIEYLATRVNAKFTKFNVVLFQIENLEFHTWPADLKSEPSVLREISAILADPMTILEGNEKEGRIEVILSSAEIVKEFCGGELLFNSIGAEVTDESGRQYTLNELGDISEAYWNEWSRNSKA